MWELEVIYFEAGLLFWTLLLALLTAYGIASAYFCMILIAFPLVIRQFTVDLLNINMLSKFLLPSTSQVLRL